MNIADRIQYLRKQKGYSQEELADKVGVSRQAVSKWESEQSTPDLEKVIAMSELFEVTTNKMRDTNPLYRTNGSIDIAGAARSILAITRTPNKEAPADELFNYMTEQGFKGFQRGEYGSTAEHLTSLQYQIKQDKERLEKLQKRIQKEQVKYEPARHISKTLNEIDSMGQKTITGKMAISKEDYSQLTALAKEGITSRGKIKNLEQSASYYRQKYMDSANALERMKTKYNELKEKCRPFLEALEHFPEVAKLDVYKRQDLESTMEIILIFQI